MWSVGLRGPDLLRRLPTAWGHARAHDGALRVTRQRGKPGCYPRNAGGLSPNNRDRTARAEATELPATEPAHPRVGEDDPGCVESSRFGRHGLNGSATFVVEHGDLD